MHKLYEWNEMLCKGLKEEMECFEKDPNPEKLHEIKEIVETIVGLTELEAAGAMREYFEDEHGYDSRTGQFPDRDWTAPHRIWNAAPMRTMPPYYMGDRDYDMMPDMDYDGVYNRAYPPMVKRGVNDRGRSRDSRGRYNEGYGIYNMAHDMPKKLTDEEKQNWLDMLQNEDGTVGETFSKDEARAIAKKVGAKFDNYTEEDFALVLNLVYSDYCNAIEKAGIDTDNLMLYGHMALSWLEDSDSYKPEEHIARYWKYIVKH